MVKKRYRLLRWIRRILIFVIIMPVITLLVIQLTGMFKMRKTDQEISNILAAHQVQGSMDTMTYKGRSVVYLHTQRNEKRKKEAMIFVHGSPGSLDAHLDYMVDSALLSQVDLITYDRPGFGASGFGKSLPSLRMQTEYLMALMNQLGYEKYWLAGHSYGAPIIVQAAMTRGKRINGLCIVSGSVSPELEPKAKWRRWIDIPLVRNLLPTALRVSNEELIPLKQDLLMIEDDWDKISCKVAICHGTKDMLVRFENLAYAQQKLVNAEKVYVRVFEGKNHFILWSDKGDVIQTMVQLLGARDGEKIMTVR